MKPRIWYCWILVRWMPVRAYREDDCIAAESVNRRIRLKHVGVHQ